MNQEYMTRDIIKVAQILKAKYDKTENYKNTFIKKYTLSNTGAVVTTTWNLSNEDIYSLIFATENNWKPTTVIDSPDEVVHRIMIKGKTIITELQECKEE